MHFILLLALNIRGNYMIFGALLSKEYRCKFNVAINSSYYG
jgi:hypothetical protein